MVDIYADMSTICHMHALVPGSAFHTFGSHA